MPRQQTRIPKVDQPTPTKRPRASTNGNVQPADLVEEARGALMDALKTYRKTSNDVNLYRVTELSQVLARMTGGV